MRRVPRRSDIESCQFDKTKWGDSVLSVSGVGPVEPTEILIVSVNGRDYRVMVLTHEWPSDRWVAQGRSRHISYPRMRRKDAGGLREPTDAPPAGEGEVAR